MVMILYQIRGLYYVVERGRNSFLVYAISFFQSALVGAFPALISTKKSFRFPLTPNPEPCVSLPPRSNLWHDSSMEQCTSESHWSRYYMLWVSFVLSFPCTNIEDFFKMIYTVKAYALKFWFPRESLLCTFQASLEHGSRQLLNLNVLWISVADAKTEVKKVNTK